jgi:putative ABC transport system permease protein
MQQFQDELVRRVRAIPAVADVGITSAIPLRGFDGQGDVRRQGSDRAEITKARYVDEGFFKAFHISAVRGRLLDSHDREGSQPVAVISEAYARRAFGAEDPIGQMIDVGDVRQVVGVIPDLRYGGLDEDPKPAIYFSRRQAPRPVFSLIVRSAASSTSGAAVAAVRRMIREMDPALPETEFVTIDQLLDASVASRRFYTVATAAFATIALLLTGFGLAVVIARAVAERRRELAIRSALGASPSVLSRVAVGGALTAVFAGIAFGLLAASSGSAFLTAFLYGVRPNSPAAYGAATLIVLGVASLAAWAPVRRFQRTALVTMLRPT